MQNDKERPGQPPIHTHLPDSVPPEDVKKIVGEQVPHGADYNSPPPQGGAKSTGGALDDSVGGPGLGAAPAPRGAAAVRDQDSRAVDQHMGSAGGNAGGNLQQGGGGNAQSAGKAGAQAQSGGSQSGEQGNVQRDSGARSEGLLPAGGEGDGRFEVSEEVSFDQQSDQARRVGSMEETAKGAQGEKLAEAVAGTLGKKDNS